MNKQRWVDAAELFDTWRVVPRIVLFGYCTWLVHIVDSILAWYFSLPAAARGIEASGMTSIVITAVTGLGTFVYKIYSDAGTDWAARQSAISRMTVTKTTVTPP